MAEARKCAQERGQGRVGFVVSVLITAIVVFVCVKVIPVKVKFFTFADKVEQKLQRSSWKSYDVATQEMMKYVREQAAFTGLSTDKLRVRMPPPVTGEMVVVVDWDVPIDLAVTKYVWKYHLEKRAPMLGKGGSAF